VSTGIAGQQVRSLLGSTAAGRHFYAKRLECESPLSLCCVKAKEGFRTPNASRGIEVRVIQIEAEPLGALLGRF